MDWRQDVPGPTGDDEEFDPDNNPIDEENIITRLVRIDQESYERARARLEAINSIRRGE